jgi:hypothetical protein
MTKQEQLEDTYIYLSKELRRASDDLDDEELANILLAELGTERVGTIIKILLSK